MQTSMDKVAIGLQKYCNIMSTLNRTDVSLDRDFQRRFNGFYRIRQRSALFYTSFFQFLELHKQDAALTFEAVIRYLFETTGSVCPSFASKLVATVRPELPVWDRYVLTNLGLKAPGYYLTPSTRIQRCVDLYAKICAWYETPAAQEKLELFESIFPNCPISNVKKIDLILWQTRDI